MSTKTNLLAAVLGIGIAAATMAMDAVSASHSLQAATAYHLLVSQNRVVDFRGAWGEDKDHIPEYDYRAYAQTVGVYTSGEPAVDHLQVTARMGTSCNHGGSWYFDDHGFYAGGPAVVKNAYSGGWLEPPNCESFPKYAVETYHYVRPDDDFFGEYAYKNCFVPETEWYWSNFQPPGFKPCFTFVQQPPPAGWGYLPGRGISW